MAQLRALLNGRPGNVTGAARLVVVLLLACSWLTGPLAGPLRALDGQLNINQASVEELATLPFTGQKRAQAIVDYRRQHGPFESAEELINVDGIGPITLQAVKPYIKLNGPSTLQGDFTRQPPEAGKQPATKSDHAYNVQAHIATQPGEIVLLTDQLYFDTLLGFIGQASRRIDMAMFLFKTTDSPGNRPTAVLQALIAARRRGVEVRVVLENSDYDDKLNATNRRAAKVLTRNKIRVEFDSKGQTSHMKLVVIDERFCFLGSHNMTHAALAFNHEVSVLIDNQTLARELGGFITTLPSP